MSEKMIYDAKKDPRYSKPYIDADEMRERSMPDGSKKPFRYVHGGFEGTNAKFVFCFPRKEDFKGRFYQYLCPFPGPDEEVASLARSGEDDTIAFCLTYGAYFVETNMESASAFGGHPDPHKIWQPSAAAAIKPLPASRIPMPGTEPALSSSALPIPCRTPSPSMSRV